MENTESDVKNGKHGAIYLINIYVIKSSKNTHSQESSMFIKTYSTI